MVRHREKWFSWAEPMLSPEFEKVACPFCGANDFSKLFDATDIYYGAPGVFTVARCNSCSLVMQNPRPRREKIAVYYSAGYEPHSMAESSEDIEKMVAGQEGRCVLLERHARKGRALDIGSGDGRFLLCLKRRGWDVKGCELIERMAEYQRTKLGIETKACDLIAASYPAEHFDAITLWSVLEHLYDPFDTLVEIRRIMKPDGTLIISVPNFDSLERKIFRERWYPLSVPYHIFHFTPKTLGRFVEKAGLKVEKVYYATTATGVLRSINSNSQTARGSGVAAGRHGVENPGATSHFTLKRIVFNGFVVPTLRLIDAMHLGGTTNFVIRK
jgi:2-polyprenyl-3-methyl-5-hydroxy-6-metoxy-1,4-benzoquinol methylase